MKESGIYARKNVCSFPCFLLLSVLVMVGCEKDPQYEEARNTSLLSADEILTRGSFETDAFITEWNVPKDSVIQLPLDTAYFYNFIVDWGDDSNLQQFTNQNLLTAKHRYAQTGAYRVRLLGTCETWRWINRNATKKFLTKVIQWGNVNFKSMAQSFMDCTNLISIPAGIPNVESYNSAFLRCTALTSLPEGLFANCYKGKYFTSVFSSCTNLRMLPKNLFKDCVAAVDFNSSFYNTGIQLIPEGMFKNCHNIVRFMTTFEFCRQLMEIPKDLFEDCENVELFFHTFSGCTSLTTLPRELFDNCKNVKNFMYTFFGCTALTGYTPNTNGIELWERTPPDYPAAISGTFCFKGCTNLTNYAAIPEAWK